ncbi:hypothetical protein LAJ19_09090 [Deinococcus taeanensis]|uniref:hypothetical protein n=1 Tax=Deinococcus taeanensis TaxID=2737050 RepID=UPI001CDBED06|nr:hypothetical protein [Deinococcus taeanensis]UBV41804.1 hypothetical protein LAJ19_09090 [Deinococcus taeanensis]
MARTLKRVLGAARTGSRAVRVLLRPAQSWPARPPQDPWQLMSGLPDPAAAVQRGMHGARRAAGLGVLLLLTLLALSFLATLTVLLGIGVASGSDLAGWLLGLTLLLSLALTGWSARRARMLLRAPPAEPVTLETGPPDEQDLVHLLRRHERALPAPTLRAFHSAVTATRDALRATRDAGTLTRDAFDARQAAREDLPQVLSAYHDAPPQGRDDQELLRQLHLIEQRMTEVSRVHAQARRRDQQSRTRYLQDKYTPGQD